MAVLYKHPRGTKSALDSLAGASGLILGTVYYITDQSRLAVATSTSAYTMLAKQNEVTGWSSTVTATGTGSSQGITLSESGLTPKDVFVFVNGVKWETDEYTISGTTLTITTSANGDSVEIIKQAGPTGAAGATGSTGAGHIANGEVTGTPGTGAGTLTNAAKGLRTLNLLRSGQAALFRWDDGSAWELRWGFWNGTTVSRPTNGFVSSSSGSGLTLSSAAEVTLISELGLWQRGRSEVVGMLVPSVNSASPSSIGFPTSSTIGTLTAVPFDDTSTFTREPQYKQSSATTANADCGRYSSAVATSRNTSFHFSTKFGCSSLPTGPRLCIGLTNNTSGMGADPSAFTDCAFFGKDSADTNIQFMVNDSSGTATKTDTGIALATSTLYEAVVWCSPAGNMQGLLIDYTNSVLFYTSASSNLPTAATGMGPRIEGGLSATTGTAFTIHCGATALRNGL